MVGTKLAPGVPARTSRSAAMVWTMCMLVSDDSVQ
jgi:hypothetical protein